ncbi:response regulator, partial [Bacillus taeanensis]
QVDILLIDLLMPIRDGIETIRYIKPTFKGKIIMISQVESKELIGEAYLLGIDHYITKPINKVEVLAVIRKVIEHTRLEKSLQDIHKSLNNVLHFDSQSVQRENSFKDNNIVTSGRFLLSELGIAGEKGSKDLLDILHILFNYEKEHSFDNGFPSLKETFDNLAEKKYGKKATEMELIKERKASKQRVRRAIYQSLEHLASLGLTDFSNPKFENYASLFFDFTTVRKKMNELTNESTVPPSPTRINMKKFIQVLYFEAKRIM